MAAGRTGLISPRIGARCFGWGVFDVPPDLAAQRRQLRACELRDQAREAARAAAQLTRRPKVFRPKQKKPQPAEEPRLL
jgi:hypothetical protein